MNIEQIAMEVSDELVKSWQQSRKMPPLAWDFRGFAIDGMRRCLSKLAEQDMEPVAWYTDDHLSDKSATTYDPIVAERWYGKGWPTTRLYDLTQLLAAQQRTAEACAKMCEDEIGNTPNDQRMLAAIDCAAMIRNGEWREYL